MAVYYCDECGEAKDDDWNPGSEWGEGLICEDCLTEVGAAFEEDKGREEKNEAELYEWAKDNY